MQLLRVTTHTQALLMESQVQEGTPPLPPSHISTNAHSDTTTGLKDMQERLHKHTTRRWDPPERTVRI